jgi:antitoxin (DNA-binding transcriptional repressor) of toxin-antitoxin stability system
MDTIPTNRAERELSELIHRAASGETIILEAPSGERVRLEPVEECDQDRVPGLLKGKIKVPARLFEPMTAEELRLWYGDDT